MYPSIAAVTSRGSRRCTGWNAVPVPRGRCRNTRRTDGGGSMTQEAASRSGRDVWRVAASGDPVELTLPALLGDYRWYGNTRLTGTRLARQFFLAPAGEHRAIPEKILPGGRQVRRTMRGYDA